MIVGGYSMNLYCDDPKHRERHPDRYTSLDGEYFGHTEADCRKQARRDGWVFHRDRTATCPKCAKSSSRN